MKSIAKVLVPAALALSSFAAVAAPTGAGSAFHDDPFSTFDRYQVSAAATTAPQSQGAAAVRRDDPFAGFNDVAGAPARAAVKAGTQRAAQPRPASWDDPFAS